jgi:hypothetical protein
MMAERGIFAFDSDPDGGPYRLVACPEIPVRVSELPAAVAAVARRITYLHLEFAELSEVSPALLKQRS